MGSAVFFCVILALIQSSKQYSLGGPSLDSMVSDGWTGDIMTDGWNAVPRGCSGKPADVYFVLDTASDVGPAELKEQKRFLGDLTALFPLSEYRVGVVTFGFTPMLSTPLGKASSLPQLRAAVRNAPRVGGRRRTAQALKYLRETAFSPFSDARTDVAHVVILLTNGRSAYAKQTAQEAEALRKQGVIVFVVSTAGQTGQEADQGELEAIASRPTGAFVFNTDSWAIVDSLIEVLHIRECNYQVLPPLPGREPVCASRRPTALAFAVEHLGLGTPKTQKIITFIQDLLADVDADSPMQAAILTSRDPIARHALSNHVDTVRLLEQKLGGLEFPDLSQLLRRAGKVLKVKNSHTRQDRHRSSKNSHDALIINTPQDKKMMEASSQDTQKVLLVFVDDSVHINRRTLSASKANRRHKVDTYVVYVGGEEMGEGKEKKEEKEGLDSKKVERLASGRDHVIRISGYDQLSSRGTIVKTLRTVCRGL